MANKNTGSLIPTTWPIPEESDELRTRLYQYLNSISIATNSKDIGSYILTEIVNGQTFFPNPNIAPGGPNYLVPRSGTRKVVNFGALPNTATKSVAHGIAVTANTSWTRTYATATDPVGLTGYTLSGNDVVVDATNVNITTAANKTNYTICYVTLEFLQR